MYFATLIVNNDEEGAGHTEEAGADEDEHRDQQHEHEVGVGGLQSITKKKFCFSIQFDFTSKSRWAATKSPYFLV